MRCVPRLTLSASVSALVVSGLVLGISKTVVTPPSTAAREPLSRSSLCSSPGSRKCTWLSITPGSICRPRQSIVCAGACRAEIADRRDAAAAHADIAQAGAVVVDHRSALQDEVVVRHRPALAGALRAAYVKACRIARSGLPCRPFISGIARLSPSRASTPKPSCRTSSPPISPRSAQARRGPSALLSPQGKILFDFLVSRDGEAHLILDCRAALADDFLRRLSLYKLRAKATIAKRDQALVAVSWGDDSSASQTDSSPSDDALPQCSARVSQLCPPAACGKRVRSRLACVAHRARRCRKRLRLRRAATRSRMTCCSTRMAASASRRAATSARKWCRACSTAAPRDAAC